MRFGLVMLMLCGCATAPCPDVGVDLDTPDDAAPADAGSDVPTSSCSPITPGIVEFWGGFVARGSGETVSCPGQFLVHVYTDGGVLYWSSPEGESACDGSAPPLPAGDYLIAAEMPDDPRWVVGASLLRPDHCAGLVPTPPHCAPLRLRLAPCDRRMLWTVLYCDPLEGECPTGFPGELPL